MKTLRNLLFTLAVALCLPSAAAFAAVPWGAISAQTGATPTCTSFSTDPVCIDTLSTTQTSLTLSGGTAGGYYTLVLMQDGTGSRTFTNPTNVTADPSLNGGVIPAIPTTANQYTVWVLKGVGTTPTYSLLAAYDNLSLKDVFSTTFTSLGTAVSATTTQSQGSVVIPGVTVADIAVCSPQTTPATWQTGVFLNSICGTNFCQCQEVNPTAASATPTAITVNVKIMRP